MRGIVALVALLGGLALAGASPARASTGCTVLLCLAGNWRNISQCVPPVTQVLRDLLRGRAFPTCAMAGAGNGAGNRDVPVPECPGPYLSETFTDGTFTGYVCNLSGVIEVTVNGALWSKTYWDSAGNSITEYTATAKTQLGAGNYDTAFDEAMDSWRQTPAFEAWNCRINQICPPPPPGGGGGG